MLRAMFFRSKLEENPIYYGWELEPGTDESMKMYQKAGGWKLYKSDTGGWVLDKVPKYGPGVVARMGQLTSIEIEFANNMTSLQSEPTRIRS